MLNNLVNDVSYSEIITAIIADHLKPRLALEKDRYTPGQSGPEMDRAGGN